jgi:hypothetical protein
VLKRFPTPVLLAALVSVCLAVAACGAGSTGGSTGGSHSGGTSTTAPTATAAFTGATSVPVASTAECGTLLPLSAANQDTNPVSPATSIFALEVSSTGLCYYESAAHQTNVALLFKAYSGGNLTQSIESSLSSSVSKVQLASSQVVTGVGSQAEYITITGSSTVNGVAVPIKENILFFVDGAVSFGIINIIYNNVNPLGSQSASTVLSDFEQVAQVVISHA